MLGEGLDGYLEDHRFAFLPPNQFTAFGISMYFGQRKKTAEQRCLIGFWFKKEREKERKMKRVESDGEGRGRGEMEGGSVLE